MIATLGLVEGMMKKRTVTFTEGRKGRISGKGPKNQYL